MSRVLTATPIPLENLKFKDLSRVKTNFKSFPLQFYFEITVLSSAEKWRKIQNIYGEPADSKCCYSI